MLVIINLSFDNSCPESLLITTFQLKLLAFTGVHFSRPSLLTDGRVHCSTTSLNTKHPHILLMSCGQIKHQCIGGKCRWFSARLQYLIWRYRSLAQTIEEAFIQDLQISICIYLLLNLYHYFSSRDFSLNYGSHWLLDDQFLKCVSFNYRYIWVLNRRHLQFDLETSFGELGDISKSISRYL